MKRVRYVRLSALVTLLIGASDVGRAEAADTTAPRSPTGVSVTAYRSGTRLTWTASSSTDVAGYNIYRRASGSSTTVRVNPNALIKTQPFFNAGLVGGASYSYLVRTVDTSGNESASSPLSAVVKVVDPLPPPTKLRAANCPSATITVPGGGDLQGAFDRAKAGDVIRIQPGVFSARTYKLANKVGTADRPIWICGDRKSILTRNGFAGSETSPLRVDNVSHVIFTGFSIVNSMQGLMVRASDHVTISDLKVTDIGQEAIHLYALTTDSVVTHNQIERTGKSDVSVGEGIYIGTSQRRWDVIMGDPARPDASNRNVITENVILDAGAEGIEAKEGTADGIIEGNTIEGHLPTSNAHGWILVTGNGWLVRGNSGLDAVNNGIRNLQWNDWGRNNVFVANSGDVNAEYGLQAHTVDLKFPPGLIVTCNHVFTNYSASTWSNYKACQN